MGLGWQILHCYRPVIVTLALALLPHGNKHVAYVGYAVRANKGRSNRGAKEPNSAKISCCQNVP